MASYLTSSDADTLAASLPNLAAYLAASGTVKAQALELATERFDTARRYQGRMYDPDGLITGTLQVLQFPRIARGEGFVLGSPAMRTFRDIWDWDPSAGGGSGAAVVPPRVKRAVLFEANSIIAGTRDATLEAINRGLASQSTGSLSESYRNPNDAGGVPRLCSDAEQISLFYRFKSGPML